MNEASEGRHAARDENRPFMSAHPGNAMIQSDGTPARSAPGIHIIGASIPRSGHHLLARLLEAALGDRFFYCEAYGDMGCCRTVPCRFRERRQVSFQKSHDFKLDLPNAVPDALYLIQHRSPVPVAISAREYYIQEDITGLCGEIIASDRDEYAVWLGRFGAYYVGFWERWLSEPPLPNSIRVEYDDLSAHPRDVLDRLFASFGLRSDDHAIDDAVTRVVGRAGHFGERTYVPKPIETRRYYDPELLAQYEAAVVEHLPDLAEQRTFPPVEYRQTLVGQVFEARRLAQRGDAQAALAITERALRGRSTLGLLLYEKAIHLQTLGRHDEAAIILREAVALGPPHPIIMEALIALSLFLGDMDLASDTARSLVALVGEERAGPVAVGLTDSEGPVQGKGTSEAPKGGIGSEADRIRQLQGEVVAREVALRQTERRLVEKEQIIAQLASVADERQGLIDRLTADLDERLRLIDRLTAEEETVRKAAEERLELILRLVAERDGASRSGA
jgi:tetratricopeptide (TPR) repeat protein